MEPRSEPDEHARLIAQLGWVQRLAAAIVRDPNAAEDVAQDAARIALARREPLDDSIGQRSVDGLRAWLAAVVRQVARNRASADASRRACEHSVAREDAKTGAEEIVERSARARRVAEAVARLEEPYRRTRRTSSSDLGHADGATRELQRRWSPRASDDRRQNEARSSSCASRAA